jgi:hypothetical protein
MTTNTAGAVSEEMVRQAIFLCPHELATPAKHRWIASELNRRLQDNVANVSVPQRLFVFQHPLEPDEKVERQREYARGWNACIDAIELGAVPPPPATKDSA